MEVKIANFPLKPKSEGGKLKAGRSCLETIFSVGDVREDDRNLPQYLIF